MSNLSTYLSPTGGPDIHGEGPVSQDRSFDREDANKAINQLGSGRGARRDGLPEERLVGGETFFRRGSAITWTVIAVDCTLGRSAYSDIPLIAVERLRLKHERVVIVSRLDAYCLSLLENFALCFEFRATADWGRRLNGDIKLRLRRRGVDAQVIECLPQVIESRGGIDVELRFTDAEELPTAAFEFTLARHVALVSIGPVPGVTVALNS